MRLRPSLQGASGGQHALEHLELPPVWDTIVIALGIVVPHLAALPLFPGRTGSLELSQLAN